MIPALRPHEIEIVVRIGLSWVKDRLDPPLDVGEIEFGLGGQLMVHPIDSAIPMITAPSADMSTPELSFMSLQIGSQPRKLCQID